VTRPFVGLGPEVCETFLTYYSAPEFASPIDTIVVPNTFENYIRYEICLTQVNKVILKIIIFLLLYFLT
jgi:hypothetical protein